MDEFEDFSHEEELFRQAFARHADDLADEPIGFAPPTEQPPARRIPLAVRWLAVAAAAGVIGGGGWMYLNRTDEAVPGPSAQSASPAPPTPSVTPTVTTSASPSPTPSPTATRPTASATPSGNLTPPPATRTPSQSPSVTVTSTPSATSTVRASSLPTSTLRGAPTTVTSPMDELGDYNPNDPVPAPADQLTIQTPVTATGWGAYQLGMSEQAMKDRKLVVPSTTRCEGSLEAITAHKTVGLVLVDSTKDKGLWGFTVRNPMVRTDRGAGVGMTMAQVQKLYGSAFAYEKKMGEGTGSMVFGRVRQGNNEIIFLTGGEDGQDTPATPSSVVTGMTVRQYGTWWPQGAGC